MDKGDGLKTRWVQAQRRKPHRRFKSYPPHMKQVKQSTVRIQCKECGRELAPVVSEGSTVIRPHNCKKEYRANLSVTDTSFGDMPPQSVKENI